jgi:hypothetical protein
MPAAFSFLRAHSWCQNARLALMLGNSRCMMVRHFAPLGAGFPPAVREHSRRVPWCGPAFQDPATRRDPKEREIPKNGTGAHHKFPIVRVLHPAVVERGRVKDGSAGSARKVSAHSSSKSYIGNQKSQMKGWGAGNVLYRTLNFELRSGVRGENSCAPRGISRPPDCRQTVGRGTPDLESTLVKPSSTGSSLEVLLSSSAFHSSIK